MLHARRKPGWVWSQFWTRCLLIDIMSMLAAGHIHTHLLVSCLDVLSLSSLQVESRSIECLMDVQKKATAIIFPLCETHLKVNQTPTVSMFSWHYIIP